jgi:hypothetical protein
VTGQVEIQVEADGGVIVETGERWDGLLIRYRAAGGRRWAKFIVVASPGQSLRDLLVAAIAVVERADAHFDGRAVQGSIQLELGGAVA